MTTVEARACRLSSPIPSGLTPLCDAGPLQEAETPPLFAYLATITDQGHAPAPPPAGRHPGACRGCGRGRCAVGRRDRRVGRRDTPAGPGCARRPPRPAHRPPDGPDQDHIRRTLGRLDAQALATAIGAWLADRANLHRQQQRRRAVAVDAKTLRGVRDAQGRQVHLLAAMDHATRAVLAQRQVDGAPGEVPACGRCWLTWRWPAWWSPLTPCIPTPTPPSSWSPKAGLRPVHRQGQPAHPTGPLRRPGLAQRARRRPHPRPGPRPRGALHPQGRHRQPPLRVPPRRPGPAAHPRKTRDLAPASGGP
jgi:hypothetical protein